MEAFHHWSLARCEIVRATAVRHTTPWHDHVHLVLGLIEQGACDIELRGRFISVRAGEAYVLPPRLAHRLLAGGAASYRVLCLQADASGAATPAAGVIRDPQWCARFACLLDAAMDEAAGDSPAGIPDAICTLIEAAIATLGSADTEMAAPGAVRQLHREIQRNPAQREKLEESAHHVGW